MDVDHFVLYGDETKVLPQELIEDILQPELDAWFSFFVQKGNTRVHINTKGTLYETVQLNFTASYYSDAVENFKKVIESHYEKTGVLSVRVAPQIVVRDVNCPLCGLQEVYCIRARLCAYHYDLPDIKAD